MIAIFLTACLCVVLQIYKLPKCRQDASDYVLEPQKVSIIAHRGGAYDAPENTLAAIKEVHGSD